MSKVTKKTQDEKDTAHAKRVQRKKEKEAELHLDVDMYTKLANKILKSVSAVIVGVAGVIATIYVSISNVNTKTAERQILSQSSLEAKLVEQVTDNKEQINLLSEQVKNVNSEKLDKIDYIKKILDEEFRKIRNNDLAKINVESVKQIDNAITSGLLDKEPLFILSTAQYVTKTYKEHMFFQDVQQYKPLP